MEKDFNQSACPAAGEHDIQARLRALEADFESLSNNLSAAVFIVDRNRCLRRYNQRAAEDFDLTRDAVGQPIDDACLGFPANALDDDVEAVLEDLTPREKDLATGSERWYRRRITPSRDGDGALITYVDITRQQRLNDTLEGRVRERVRTLELLRQVSAIVNSARSVSAAFRDVSDAVCDYLDLPFAHAFAVQPSNHRRVLRDDIWSSYARREYGELVETWRDHPSRAGEGLVGAIDWPDRAEWFEVDKLPGLARRGPRVPDFKPRLGLLMPVRVSGQTAAVIEFYNPEGPEERQPVLELMDRVGDELGYIVEREWFEFRVLEQQRGLARINRLAAIGEMAGGIAHQLNQPLTAIRNYVAAARRLANMPERDTGRLERLFTGANEQAQRATDYIESMRQFARGREPELEEMDVEDMLASAIELVRPASRAADITVEMTVSPALPAIYADTIQLEQVFVGLLMNAIEAMEELEDGERTVNVVASCLNPEQIRITVRDRGHGIPDDVLESLFEPFFSTRKKSIGMGLAVARSVIEASGGRIHAEQVAPRGTRFHVDLPVEK